MKTKIQKWGDHLALCIPESMVTETGLEPDTVVNLSLVDGNLIVTPIEQAPTLEHLLGKITDHNIHGEIDTGRLVGNELF